MNSFSREKRNEFDIFKDYFEMYNPSEFKSFYYSTKYRCYLNADVYPPGPPAITATLVYNIMLFIII